MAKLFAYSGDPDQTPRSAASTPRSAASDLVLHCLQIAILRVPRLKWANQTEKNLLPTREKSFLSE